MGVEVIHLFLAAEGLVAGEGNDLHLGTHHLEGHVEADLVVAGSGRAMGDGIRPYLLCVTGYRDGLEYPFRGHRDRVGPVPQDVSVDHVAKALVVVLLGDVEGHIFLGPELEGPLLVVLELRGTEPAGVGACRIDLAAFFLCQVHHRERSVKTSAVGDHHFFLFLFHIDRCHSFSFPSRTAILSRTS